MSGYLPPLDSSLDPGAVSLRNTRVIDEWARQPGVITVTAMASTVPDTGAAMEALEMTDTTTMRELMARALCREMKQPEETRIIGSNEPPRQNWKKYLPHVDAILAVLETPSEAVIQAGEGDGGHSIYRWTAMVRAIRDGA